VVSIYRGNKQLYLPTKVPDGGGIKFYCLEFTAVVSSEMCPAAIYRHRHRCGVWRPQTIEPVFELENKIKRGCKNIEKICLLEY